MLGNDGGTVIDSKLFLKSVDQLLWESQTHNIAAKGQPPASPAVAAAMHPYLDGDTLAGQVKSPK